MRDIYGIRDLTVSREARLAQNWAWDAGFMFACSVGNAGNHHDPPVLAAKVNNQASAKWCLLSNQTPYGVSA